MKQEETTRVDKYLASRGISARRNIADLLQRHTVTLNGKRIQEPGIRFDEKTDVLLFDGKPLEQPEFVYIKLYKPLDVISTAADEFGRKTVVSMVPSKERLYPVGRLDQDTTGLLLLTNDGDLANHMTHPRYHIPKTYELTIAGTVPKAKIEKFERGVRLDDGMTAKAHAKITAEVDRKTVLEVVLHEGRKRQIRRMCETLHLPLISLKRVSMGPITLGDMQEGEYRNLTIDEIMLLKQEAYKKATA